MAEGFKTIVTPTLGDLITVQIDPTWLYRDEWLETAPIGEKLRFTFLDLEGGFQESAGVNYADVEAVGRAEAYKTYIGGSNREFTILFKFQVQGDNPAVRSVIGGVPSVDLDAALIAEVTQPALWLESLKQPFIANDGLSHAPPTVLFSLGSIFFGRMLVTDAQVTWQPPFDPETLLPFAAEVSVTFTEVRRRITNFFGLYGRGFQFGGQVRVGVDL